MRSFTLECREDGEVYLDGISSEVYTRGHWGFFQRKLEALVGNSVKDTVYTLFKKRAMIAVGVYSAKIVETLRIADKRLITEQLLEQLPKRGYGEPNILEFDDNNGLVVEVKNSFNAVGYAKTKHCVCYALSGIIAGGAEMLFGKQMDCQENKCIAKGDGVCEFEARPVRKHRLEKVTD